MIYNLMMLTIHFFLVLVCCISKSVTASYCYPDYCQNLTVIVPTPEFQCLLTRVQRNKDCIKLRLDDLNRQPVKGDTCKYTLSAYVKEYKGTKTTAFNLSITDANFHRLTTRYQNLLDENWSACRHVELYGNKTHPAPTEFYVSCPFSNDSYESFPYRLEYLVTGPTYQYSKQYIFTVPIHSLIGDGVDIKHYTPFIYVDISNAPLLSLFVQPHPERYNVTKYKVWVINNGTDSVIHSDTLLVAHNQHMNYNLTANSGVYYFKVTALHPECGKYGCVNGTTPFLIIREPSHRLLIMIISTVWIPPVILYAFYHIYKLYKKGALKKKKPNCLLVYSPTRLSHINVMIDLAKYLRGCNVNAVIDMLDVADTTAKDLDIWCDTAFNNADIVLIATSPPPKESAVPVVYRNVDDHFLRLLKENYSQREKKYYLVQFPYCKQNDVPDEMRHFKQFSLPKELSKLVKAIHDVEHVRYIVASDKQLLDSVQLAKSEILDDVVEETEGLLTERVGQKGSIDQRQFRQIPIPEGNTVAGSFATNIDELNLLGETGDGEAQKFPYKPSASESGFRIDDLNL